MSAFSHVAAIRRIHAAMLGLANRRLADCWLAQWRGNALPNWLDFDRSSVADLAPGLVAFELRPDETLVCTLCGDAVRAGAGMDLTGRDWLALAAPGQRTERLKGYLAITAGAVGHCMRHAQHHSGGVHYVEEVLLPFAALSNGALPVLVHIGWRPIDLQANTAEFRNSRSIPDEIAIIPLTE